MFDALWSGELKLCAHSTLEEKLTKMQSVEKSLPSTIVQKGKTPKVFCDIMQWIALCFAPDTEKPEDNVGASLTVTENCIKIHLSDDKGSARTPDYTNIEDEFLRSSNIAWENRRASTTASTGTGYNVKNDLLLFETMMTRLHWTSLAHLMHDFKADISFGRGKGIQERFDELVDRWEKHCQETEHAVTGLAILKSNLCKLITGAPNDYVNLDEKAKINIYQEYKDACVAIDNSEFINQSLGTASLRIADPYWCHELPKRDIFFLQILRRRCRRLCIYSTGAQKYLTTGLDHFQGRFARSSTDLTSLLKFEWIGDSDHEINIVPKQLTWPEGSIPFIESIIASSVDPDIKEAAGIKELLPYFTELWTEGGKVTVRVHCEVAMLYYLVKNKIDVEFATIGTARLPCYACEMFVIGAAPTRKGAWKLPETTTFLRGDWSFPLIQSGPHKSWTNNGIGRAEKVAKKGSEFVIAAHLRGWKDDDCIMLL